MDKEISRDTNINSNENSNSPLEEEKKMDTTFKRPCTPSESIFQSIKEMILMRQGKMKKRSWDDLKKELKKEK